MREVQLSPLPMRVRTVQENCERLDLPVPEWLAELAAEEAERASQPPARLFTRDGRGPAHRDGRLLQRAHLREHKPAPGRGADRHVAPRPAGTPRDLALALREDLNKGHRGDSAPRTPRGAEPRDCH